MKNSKYLVPKPVPRGLSNSKSWTAVLSLAVVYGVFAAVPARASFWTSSAVPGTTGAANDSSSVTLGLKFYSDAAGAVVGVRFYKGTSNTGTHTGVLWSATGTKLASVTFSGETASGWQQANFAAPVSIAANTTYVISYQAPRGHYADDQYYNWGGLSAAPLHISGSSPGVYMYANSPAFPNQAWNGSNYYVDLVFVPSGSGGSTKYSISGKISGTTAATVSLSGAASASAKTDSSGNFNFAGLLKGTYLLSPSQAGYVFSPPTRSVTVNNANITGQNFTAAVGVQHSVSLKWTASSSPNISGYRVYRAGTSGGPYARITASLVGATSYVDNTVSAGDTYYYVTTAVNANGLESGYSNQAVAAVP
ncbi:MAG TPA: DUF4082 domain-containing protein [Bryobacteraceae bacterium]